MRLMFSRGIKHSSNACMRRRAFTRRLLERVQAPLTSYTNLSVNIYTLLTFTARTWDFIRYKPRNERATSPNLNILVALRSPRFDCRILFRSHRRSPMRWSSLALSLHKLPDQAVAPGIQQHAFPAGVRRQGSHACRQHIRNQRV
jgi:hypothetical protein